MWFVFALLSAIFAALTSILAKVGIEGVNSNLATGASWLCYYKALQGGDASKVVPIDKLSVVITLILEFVFFAGGLYRKISDRLYSDYRWNVDYGVVRVSAEKFFQLTYNAFVVT